MANPRACCRVDSSGAVESAGAEAQTSWSDGSGWRRLLRHGVDNGHASKTLFLHQLRLVSVQVLHPQPDEPLIKVVPYLCARKAMSATAVPQVARSNAILTTPDKPSFHAETLHH